MAGKDVTIRVKVVDGTWENLGSDRARGVWPENVEINADRWGSKTASFDLRRDPDVTWPDLQPFTPVEVEVGGIKRWSGRIAQTPTRDSLDSVINVQCEGWQAHLDDDMYERVYVHTNLSDYKDMRSFPTATLGANAAFAAGQVNADGGILLSMPSGATLQSNCHVGVVLDLGPNSTAKRAVLSWEMEAMPASFIFYCRGTDSPDTASWSGSFYNDAFTVSGNGVKRTGTSTGTFATARRYVTLFLYYSGAAVTTSADCWFRITSAQVFADDAYYSATTQGSQLKAHQVVTDALTSATMLLSADRTGIDTSLSWFSLPEYAPSGPRTPRQAWESVDAFEDRTKKIDVERRPIYKERPVTAEVEVGPWSAMAFEDASAGDGGDIYNRVIVSAEQPDGTPIRSTRGQVGDLDQQNLTQVANPTFATDALNWTAGFGGTITRDTAVFDTSPASLRLTTGSLAGTVSATSNTVSVALPKNTRVGCSVRLRPTANLTSGSCIVYLNAVVGSTQKSFAVGYLPAGAAAGSWTTVKMAGAVPDDGVTGYNVRVFAQSASLSADVVYLDSVATGYVKATIVDKLKFLRTKTLDVGFKLTLASAAQIGDKWLLAHQRTPFKGRLTLQGNQSVRHITAGRSVPLDELLNRTDEFLRFSDRVDPDTGAQGRDGRIVEVSYKPATDEAVVTIDSSRARFEALLERLGLVVGQFRQPG